MRSSSFKHENVWMIKEYQKRYFTGLIPYKKGSCEDTYNKMWQYEELNYVVWISSGLHIKCRAYLLNRNIAFKICESSWSLDMYHCFLGQSEDTYPFIFQSFSPDIAAKDRLKMYHFQSHFSAVNKTNLEL